MTSMLALWAGALLALGGPVTEVAIAPEAGQTSVLISVDGNTKYRDFTMEGPNRLVVDLMGARQALPQNDYLDVNRGGIVSVKSSQFSPDVVRMVFYLDKMVDYAITRDPKGLRITMRTSGGGFEPWSSGKRSSAGAMAKTLDSGAVTSGDSEAEASTDTRSALFGRTAPQQSQARRITITFTNSPMQDVLLAFSQYSGKSIIPGQNIDQAGVVTADIHNQPWDVALNQILESHGLVGREDVNGIIRVDNIENLNQREQIEPILTRAYRINYATASELQTAVTPLLSPRGKATTGQGTNMLIVSDIQRVQEAVTQLLKELDRRTPQVSIQAKIIYVNRTRLKEMGVKYELKDLRGNQLNQLSEGVDLQGKTVPQNQAQVLLGGSSVAALGNAFENIPDPTLTLLSSLAIGRHQLISFLDALSQVNLSDIQAMPQVTTLDNVQARIMVGSEIPVRTIDAGGGATAGGVFPRAQVSTEETGIILTATPHVTSTGNILLELQAERSSADFTSSDVGFVKNTQQANTRVLVQDGETVVIAGLTQSEKSDVRNGIPLLMDLPVIGGLFRHTRHNTIQRDLIILVTPHIVQSPG